LGALVTAVAQQNQALVFNCVVHPVARPPVDALLPNAFTNRLAIPEISILKSNQPGGYARFGLTISQPIQPLAEEVWTIPRLVVEKFEHAQIVALKLLFSCFT
jgi:hypothetical protein